ncbi:hypothetical protein PAHAL_5G142200 [Panicum hallii]|jgi:hypothetical protein|uniref:Late embryogenesis abundant protein LEA-2 subgroup domain-containing protein n=1 Tax=Panicum hallii TaxID=206008 RepID=A0A2T8IJY1_9POAL|nr:hypothetical protein PAHAL_5G141600 [Panicum hallii]PVH37980.1 hypothetical protein PAHAL_5G142200 [Panicum hallii]
MAAAGLLEDDDQRDFMEKHPCIAKALAILLCLALVPFFCIWGSQADFPPSEYWVKAPGVEGLERSADAVASPTFNIILRVNNKAVWQVVCGRGDRVDVAYEGVPLAHGELPDVCVPPGTVGSVPVVATGEGLGPPDELYERMEGQRRRRERVQVRMREITGNRGAPLLLWCPAILHGRPKGPFLCAVFGQPDDP